MTTINISEYVYIVVTEKPYGGDKEIQIFLQQKDAEKYIKEYNSIDNMAIYKTKINVSQNETNTPSLEYLYMADD